MENILKEKCLIARDGEGKLIPVKVILEGLKDKSSAMMTPLTKGEFQKFIRDEDNSDELIRTHISEPSFTEEEFKHLKTTVFGAFKMALLSLTTDVSQKEIEEQSTKALLDSIESKKKFTETKVD